MDIGVPSKRQIFINLNIRIVGNVSFVYTFMLLIVLQQY